MEIICFHNPDEENGYLSNWYLASFQYERQKFSSMEQYMMHQKAVIFSDYATAGRILQTDDAGQIKELGRGVSGYNESVWNGRRQIIIYRGLLKKFQQNQDLMQKLIATGEAVLAECAVRDKVWGIGLGMNDENRFHMDKWRGQNLLGYTLMEVRKNIKSDC